MSPKDEQSAQRRRAVRWPAQLTLGLSAGALSLAWIIWGTSKAPHEPADPHEAILHPAPSSWASSMPGSRASSALPAPLTAPTQALGGTASTHMALPVTSKAPGALGVPQLPNLPNADLATQAHLAL